MEEKPLDVKALIRAMTMSSQRAEDYPPATHVISLEEINTIIKELQEGAKLDSEG
jgi:hypothetical protein